MTERHPALQLFTHLILILGVAAAAFPLLVTLFGATSDIARETVALIASVPHDAHPHSASGTAVPDTAGPALLPSIVMALGVAVLKVALVLALAFASIYFRLRWRHALFWLTFLILLFPVKVQFTPEYRLVADLGVLYSHALTLPLIAAATATFLYRLFFLTVSGQLLDTARIDGVQPAPFFRDILFPLAALPVIALLLIQFVYSWNQYLWPLVIVTDDNAQPVAVGMLQMISDGGASNWTLTLATAVLALIPSALIVLIMRKWYRAT